MHLLRNKEGGIWRGRVLFPSTHSALITTYCLKYVSLGGPAAFLPQGLPKVWGETSLSYVSCRKRQSLRNKVNPNSYHDHHSRAAAPSSSPRSPSSSPSPPSSSKIPGIKVIPFLRNLYRNPMSIL